MRTRNWFSHWVCYQIKLKCPLSRIHQWSESKFNLGPPIKTEDRESVRRVRFGIQKHAVKTPQILYNETIFLI